MNYEFEIKGSKYLFNSASLKLFKNIVPEGQEKANEVDVVKDYCQKFHLLLQISAMGHVCIAIKMAERTGETPLLWIKFPQTNVWKIF